MNRIDCDGCPAEAKAAFTKHRLELFLCGHHANEHRLTLIASGWDEAATKREEVPANA